MTPKPAIEPKHSDENYEVQLKNKLQLFTNSLKRFGDYDIEVHKSSPTAFRMRAEFRIWHEAGIAHYAMNKSGEKRPYIITQFPIGGPLIQRNMAPLLVSINADPTLSKRLFSVEFLTSKSGETLITLIYHRPLDDLWRASAASLEKELNVFVIGRSRKQKIVISQDFITERISVGGRDYQYQQIETGFTQPNVDINIKMLTWASGCCKASKVKHDLLELYCGNGNFTAVLAQHFDKVLATEVAKISVNSAQTNFQSNQINNVSVVRLSSEEITQALNGERPFRRLKEIELSQFNFSTIFVDPPRSGLDEGTVLLASQFDQILYISCNPLSLMDNLRVLCKTHDIEKVAAFDQFPWTGHLETGVLLKKKALTQAQPS
jgi:tRNA (uracil-5-)-methyltransferase